MRRVAALIILLGLIACGRGETRPGADDISGVMPDLSFRMTRASDGTTVTANSYRGKAVLLYFGYTHCPDECPTTLANLANVLHDLGPRAKNVRVLFVSVDPARDTLPILKAYVATFAPQIEGLRGTDDQIAALARRYRVLYQVTPASAGKDAEVMHSDSTFFFDPSGRARLVTTSTDDTKAIAADVTRLFQS
ncbi:MAG TPA: SCO family protein [Rhizomicrobium sp.]|jgi:protein SCO1/2|nr:SCO family protein [Rhizomicrobium sp.]